MRLLTVYVSVAVQHTSYPLGGSVRLAAGAVCLQMDQPHVPPCGVRGLDTVTLMMKDINIFIIWELKCVNITLNQGR